MLDVIGFPLAYALLAYRIKPDSNLMETINDNLPAARLDRMHDARRVRA
jgi:hypothetical protein